MNADLPFVSCLCPTFHRPKLLANALACFLAQDYPADRRELLICDDGNDLDPAVSGPNWRILSAPERFPSLPAKFNHLGQNARGHVLCVWEDDDIYLPHHISAHVNAMLTMGSGYTKPSTVLSTYTGTPRTEGASGRFHASIAFRREIFLFIGGWPLTKRADFDQQMLARLAKAHPNVADPCLSAPPSYCFRYGTTQAYHGQHFMQSPDDEEWYNRVPRRPGNRDLMLHPEFDEETRAVYASHSVTR